MFAIRFIVAIILLCAVSSTALTEELLNILNRKSSALGSVKLWTGRDAEASLVFHAGDQSAVYSIYGANIACNGKMTLVSAAGNSLLYTTKASVKEQSECPSDGALRIVGPSDEARVEVSFSSAKGGFYGSLEISGLYEERQNTKVDVPVVTSSAPSPVPCENVDWRGTVRNVSDMLQCDEVRTINEFYSGKIMQFTVETVQFKNNYLYAIMRQRDSYADYMLSPSIINTITFSEAIDIRTRERVVQSQCAFKMPMKENLRQGDTVIVSAKLARYERTWQGEFMLMGCSIK